MILIEFDLIGRIIASYPGLHCKRKWLALEEEMSLGTRLAG